MRWLTSQDLAENTLYSFQHTFVTKVYRELRKTSSPFETKSKLMLITGHSTMTALEKYLRDIDAEVPQDYSDLLSWSRSSSAFLRQALCIASARSLGVLSEPK